MKNNWPRVRISELCELIVDCVNKTAPSVTYETPYKMIRTPNIKKGRISLDNCRCVEKHTFEKWTRRARVEKGDVLLTREAPMGETGIVNFEGNVFLGQRIMQYRVNPEKLDSNYLLYSFLSSDLQFQFRRHKNSGSIVSHIGVPDCFKFELNTPPLNIQKRIALVLSSLDSKIELNNRINSELEAMAKLIYDYWFVQFDFPNAKGKPYKSSGGKMVWNEELKRDIPMGWQVKMIKNVSTIIMGQSPKGESYNKSGVGIPLINGPADYENYSLLARTFTTDPTRLCIKDDLVFCIRATIGNLTYAEKEFCLGRGVAAVRPNNKAISELLFYSLLQEIERFKIHATGSIIIGITKDDLTDSYFLEPPIEIVDKFHRIAAPMFNKQRLNKVQNIYLTNLRDWLMPMLMNGQVKVGEIKDEKRKSKENIEQKSSNLIPEVSIPKGKESFAKHVLGGKIISLFNKDPQFTTIKFQKLQYLAEQEAELDLNWNYYRQAAGPYDPKFMHTIYDSLKRSKWYEQKNFEFRPLQKADQINDYYEVYFNPVMPKIEFVFRLLKDASEAECEIVATLYAGWNDMIIRKEKIKDDVIVKTFFNWSDRKKKYEEKQIFKTLAWMKENNLTPKGFGYLIKEKKK